MNGTIAGERIHGVGGNRLGKSRAMVGTTGRAGVLAIVMGCMGCSGDEGPAVPVFPTTGRVVFEGQPAAGAFLTFHPTNSSGPGDSDPRPTATAGADGAFSLTTATKDDGAPAGEYAVTVRWHRPIKRDGELVAGPNVIPKRFGRVETTPLRVTVRETTNALEPLQIAKK